MTPTQFVTWLKGFVQAANNYNITPKQWDDVRDQLDKVELQENIKFSRYGLDNPNASITSKIPLND
jgi:hypothetical protein